MALFLTALYAEAANPIKLYVAHGSATSSADRLDKVDIDGTNVTTLASDAANFSQPENIQIDHTLGYVFMTDGNTAKQVLRFNLDGTGRTVLYTVTHTGQVRQLALDRDNQKIYFITQSATSADDRIVRINYDGSSEATIASGAVSSSNLVTNPTGLAIDTERGYLYVGDNFNTPASNLGVVRFNLDGSGRTQLVSATDATFGGNVVIFNYMAADETTGQLYFCAGSSISTNDRVMRVNSDGTGLTTLYSNSTNFTQAVSIAIDVCNNTLFIGDSAITAAPGPVWRFNLDGSGGRTQISQGYANQSTVNGLAIYSDAPTLSTVANQNISMGGSTGSLGVTVGDTTGETPAGSLILSAKSSNQTLVPNGNITLGGSGASRTINVAGAAGQTGSSTITLKVFDGARVTQNTFVVTVASSTAPTVTTPTSASITGTGATLGGNVTSDGGATITGRGVVYSVTSTNSNPQIGGTGVTQVSTTGTTGVFTVSSGTLSPGTQYSFAAYATNSAGTSYSSTGTFTTLSANADLSALSFSAGSISFSAATTSYSFNVANAITSTTVTATRADANATLQVQVNGGGFNALTSGVASGALSLNVGANTVDVKVTAQDGTTIKTYTTTITRAASANADLSALSFSAGTITPTFAAGTTSYSFSVVNATTSTTVTATKADANATLQVQLNGGGFNALTSGVASGALSLNVGANTVDVKVTAQDGTTIQTYTTTITRAAPLAAPTVTTPTSASITGTGATLGGNVTSDGGATITGRGVVYSVTSTNSNPQIGGTGVSQSSTSGTTGVFTVSSGTLTPGTQYSFAAYATNSVGTSYSSAGTFTTLNNNADLSSLTLSSGTLSPVFASATTGYTATVLRATASITTTPTVADSNATIQVRVNGGSYASVTSGAASGSLALNLGANTIDVLVTAQDGTTTKTYTTTVTRWTYLQGWRNQYFGTINNSGNAADTATPQNDGIANLMKFALGMNPILSGVQPIGVAKNGNVLEFTYPRSVEAVAECTFIVEWSDTLLEGSWSTVGVTEQILSDNGMLQQVKASASVTGLERRFMRLRVTNP